MTTIQELVEETKRLKAKMQDDGREALKGAFAKFFADHPEARAIVWVQYTPYFNDGDACIFGVNEFELKVHADKMAEDVRGRLGEDEDEEDDDGYSYGYGDTCAAYTLRHIGRDLSESEKSLVDDFRELWNGCRQIEEVFKLVLDDHVKVVATPEGFQADEYEHD